MTPDREPWTQAAPGIAAALPELAFLIGPDLRFAACNHPDHADLHAPWATLQGRPLASVGPAALAQRTAEVCATGGAWRLTYALRRHDGRHARFEASIAPLPDGAGWLYVTRDLGAHDEDAHHARAMRGLTDGLWECDLRSGQQYFSPRAQALLAWPSGWSGGLAELLHADDQAPWRAALQSHLRHGAPLDIDVRLAGPDTRWLRCRGWSERNAQGQPTRVLATLSDITVAKFTEQALGDSQAKFRALFHLVPVGIALLELDGQTVVEANDELARLLGWPAQALAGQPAAALGLAPLCAAMAARGRAEFDNLALPRRDGTLLHAKLVADPVELGGRALLLCAVTDISEQVAAEAQARRHRQELSALAEQLMDQERRTTRRLAQALHDQLGQTLTALRLTLELGGAATAPTPAQQQSRQLVDQALREVRQVLVELRPPLLEDEGLAAALDNELATRRALHPGVRLVLDTDAALQDLRWPAQVEYALFMVAREGMENALRHAGPSEVRLGLQGGADTLELCIDDDGPGLAPGAERGRPGHLGLIGMRERARAIGATLEFGRADSGGTRLSLLWKQAS